MNPSNIPSSDNIENDDINPEIERWFDDALSSLRSIAIPFLWTRILNQLMIVGYPNDKYINVIKSNNWSDNRKQEIPYLFDDMTIQVLVQMLSRQYPKVIAKLERNRSRMPRIIEEQSRHSKYINYCLRTQQKCNHEYKVPLNKILYENSGKKILHCRKVSSEPIS